MSPATAMPRADEYVELDGAATPTPRPASRWRSRFACALCAHVARIIQGACACAYSVPADADDACALASDYRRPLLACAV